MNFKQVARKAVKQGIGAFAFHTIGYSTLIDIIAVELEKAYQLGLQDKPVKEEIIEEKIERIDPNTFKWTIEVPTEFKWPGILDVKTWFGQSGDCWSVYCTLTALHRQILKNLKVKIE